MQVIFHEDFYQVYTSDPAAAAGRMEAIVKVIEPHVQFVSARPATEAQITLAHTQAHINSVRQSGLYEISALAAGGAIQAADGFFQVGVPGVYLTTLVLVAGLGYLLLRRLADAKARASKDARQKPPANSSSRR